MQAQTNEAQTADRPPSVQILEARHTDEPCWICGEQIGPGWLYVVGPPVRHVACSTRRIAWNS